MSSPFAPLTALSDALAWAVVFAFLAGIAIDVLGRREHARLVAAGAWGVFAVFWLSVVPHFAVEVRSPIEGIGALVAIPLSLSAGYLLVRGRDSLVTLSRAVGFMALLYYPPRAIPAVREFLIETVAVQTDWGLALLGYDPAFVTAPDTGYLNTFVFADFSTYIVWACTGMGSIAIFGGLIAAANADLGRKIRAFALAVGIIWVLNWLRNVFVAAAAGHSWFDHPAATWLATDVAGVPAEHTSFWIAHTAISQSLSVLALVGITLLVVRRVPEALSILSEALYVATRTEYDLQAMLAVESPSEGQSSRDGGREEAA
ncbi:MAG: archaeosortase A [Halolamina sp.]